MTVVVTYEDRPDALAGVELLARSLARHSPAMELFVYSPHREIADRLSDLPKATWVENHDLVGKGWNVKPKILLKALADHESVLWLDSDIIIIKDISPVLQKFSSDAMVVGREYHLLAGEGGKIRASAHGISCTRPLPYPVNSGSVLVTRKHRNIMEKWSSLLEGESYKAAQRIRASKRLILFMGDQDVLWAVLVSNHASDFPVEYLHNGHDMIQHCGANAYHVRDRVRVLMGAKPSFVHMLGRYKPWSFPSIPSLGSGRSDYAHLVCFELSPYFEEARLYSSKLGDPVWLKRRTTPAKVLHRLFLGNSALQGLPFALAAWLAEMARDLCKTIRRS